MVGHLHLVSNALGSAVTKTRILKLHFKHGLQALLGLLNSRGLRHRLQITCLPREQCHAFDHFNKQLLDWRWESLGDALDQIVPLVPILQQYFDLSKFKSGHYETMSEIDAALLKTVSLFLNLTWLRAFLEMLRCVAVTVNLFIGWLEGCACHERIWKMNKPWHVKQQSFFQETGLTQ